MSQIKAKRPTKKQIEREIEAIYYKLAERCQIDVMKIGAMFKDATDQILAGVPAGYAVGSAAVRHVASDADRDQTLTGVAKAEVIERVIARCVKDKVWRSACEAEATGYASKAERKVVLAYVKAQYNAAGAGFSGRWQ